MTTPMQEARARAAERSARREHRRLTREKLAALRAKLREAIQQKKVRMKEIVATCRAQRLEVRAKLREMRTRSQREISERARSERATARAACLEQKQRARKSYDTVVDLARAELAAERQRQAEERRINREERERRTALREAHATGAVHHAVRSSRVVDQLAPLHARAKADTAPGESRTEAILRYAETHPEQVHAILEPAVERAIEATEAQIAQVARTMGAPSSSDLQRAGRVAKKRSRPREEPASRTIVLGRVEDDFEVVSGGRRDLGERPETRAVRVPKVIVWKNAVAKGDVRAERAKAEAFASKDGWTVVEYAASEKDPLARAKRDVLQQDRRAFPSMGAITPATRPSKAARKARAKTSAPSGPHKEESALREAVRRAIEAMRKLDRKRQGINEAFERGRYGRRSRAEMYEAAAAADREAVAAGARMQAAEAAFRAATGREHWHETPPSTTTTASAAKSPNAYELKRAARIERMRTRASKLSAAAEGEHTHAREIGSHIPMGQPVLLGHHSQRRHQRDLERIDRGYRKSFALAKKAKDLARRAASAEKSRAVSSDDPEAIDKLREKLAQLEAQRVQAKAANAAIRRGGDVLGALVRLGIREDIARKMTEKDFAGRIGVPDYVFKNVGAEVRRVEQRIKALEARAAAPEKPAETIGLARIFEAENRVRVEFPSVPPEPLRRALKGAGFRWSPTSGAWQRHASNGAWAEARRIAAATV